MDHVAVLPDPTETGLFRPCLVEQRSGINADAPAAGRSLFTQPATDTFQPLFHNPVVVAAPAVPGHLEPSRFDLLIDVVIQADGQQALHPIK